jgi:hypothetical protein
MVHSNRLAGLAVLSFALLTTGCTLGRQNIIPAPGEGDCYSADRVANASPMVGSSFSLHGRLHATVGCVAYLKALTEAKRAGVDLSLLPR